ncbi:metallophosphoesterase family protein [Aureliella helgolandensis]|uniref:metallophosphoesterase family protein n=1 Tax=Aureliella helgolandensis TaxID=2527968 RepID=UPI001E606FE2|nr:metallophosphoesterase family protein [Aureliella helgolandensis]
MRRAIVSDIHGNLEALKAVLADIQSQNCEQIICLGDIVGYGPEPQACIDAVREFDATILGNHDLAALFDPEGFSNAAEQAIMWTRQQIEAGDSPEACYRRLQFLAHLPRTRREGSLMFVHGSVRNPVNEYVFPEDVYNRRKMEKLFSMVQRICFQGHTHVPGVFTPDMTFLRPEDLDHRYRTGDEKIMVNVGSVGQPRDGDWRSCYAIFDDPWLEFRRVEYPLDTTIQAIYDIPELDNFLGDRLREGR